MSAIDFGIDVEIEKTLMAIESLLHGMENFFLTVNRENILGNISK